MDPFTLLYYKLINDIIFERENNIRRTSPDPDIIAEDIEKTKKLQYDIMKNARNKNQIKSKKIYPTVSKLMKNYKNKMEDVRITKKAKKNCS